MDKCIKPLTPGRDEHQCSDHYRSLIRSGDIVDDNFRLNGRGLHSPMCQLN